MNVTIPALNPKPNIYNLLGELATHPKFLTEADVYLSKDDAVDRLQQIILAALLRLSQNTNFSKPLSVADVENFLQAFPNAYKTWDQENGASYLTGTINLSAQNNIQKDYEMVKKYHYLRIYMNNGIDISDLLDYRHLSDNNVAEFRQMSIRQVIDYFSNKTDSIKKTYQNNANDIQSFEIGDGIVDHIQHLSDSSMFGYPFQNQYYNQLFGGMRKNKFMLRSTVTGGGKTRQALKDFCNVAFDSYFDKFKNQWIKTGSSQPALFISTELNKAELQNIILAYLTGMDSKTITFGNFNPIQKKLLNHAVKIIRRAEFYFEYVEDFNVSDIESIIDKYARQYNVKYVNFDYIQEEPRLMQELKQSYGNGLRSDQALVYLSKELKKMSEKYHIFIMSATQVNGFFSDDDKEKSRTEYTLRGGKSTADKTDFGIITSRFTRADHNAFEKVNELKDYHPNYAHHIYKNRNGQKDVIIWTRFNYGNLREKALVITDYEYNVIHDIKPLDIQYV